MRNIPLLAALTSKPQLVGIFDKRPAQYFGVVYQEKRYLKGVCVDKLIPAGYLWFNETFERIDPYTKKRPKDAQPQPKPKTLSKARRSKSIFH
jgi:hypothetical protein